MDKPQDHNPGATIGFKHVTEREVVAHLLAMSKSTTADLKTLLVTFEHQPRAVRSSLGTEFLRIALDRDAEPVSRVEAALTVSNKAGMLGIVGPLGSHLNILQCED